MKKMMLVSICLVALISCGDIEIRPDSPIVEAQEAEVERVLFLGTDANRGACATSFVRVAPGLCVTAVGGVTIYNGVSPLGCQLVSLSGVPPHAKTVILKSYFSIKGLNAVGFRGFDAFFYNVADSGCVNSVARHTLGLREEVATVAALGDTGVTVSFVPTDGASIRINLVELGVGTLTLFDLGVVGYTD